MQTVKEHEREQKQLVDEIQATVSATVGEQQVEKAEENASQKEEEEKKVEQGENAKEGTNKDLTEERETEKKEDKTVTGKNSSSQTQKQKNDKDKQKPEKDKDVEKENEQQKKENSPAEEKEEQKEISCSVTIDSSILLSHMEDLQENIRPYVPESGYILEEQKVKLREENTAYDILQLACQANDIQLDAVYTPMYSGYYVKGIGYLYEKQAGRMSGWLYQVNGKVPNVGAGSYKLKDGDKIMWIYTCSGRIGS